MQATSSAGHAEAGPAPMAGYIGQALRRTEDRRLLTGGGRYVGDLFAAETRALAVAFARSPYARARIGVVDSERAARLPGVVGVFTSADLPDLGPLPAPGPPFLPDFEPCPPYHPLAVGETRFVGEPVAAVVAETPEQAADAAAELEIGYEPLPSVAAAEEALAAGAPLVHPSYAGNVLARRRKIGGDPERAFASAARVVRRRLRHARVAAIPMESRGVLAEHETATGRLLVRISTQAPFLARGDLSAALGSPPDGLRVISPDVGGGFGAKAVVHAEEAVVAALARSLGRPVAWVATRSEDLQTTMQGRDMLSDVEAAVNADGM